MCHMNEIVSELIRSADDVIHLKSEVSRSTSGAKKHVPDAGDKGGLACAALFVMWNFELIPARAAQIR